MKALVKRGFGLKNIGIEEIPEPNTRCDELKLRVLAAGICGTDIHIMRDEYSCNPPVVMGHEYVGVVEEVGSEVFNFSIGDHVVSLTAVYTCRECTYCKQALYMLCDKRLSIGSGLNGAFAEYLTIPASMAFKLPAGVQKIEEFALSEPLACVVRGVVERCTVKAGDTVLVSGPGTIGLLAVQLAKLQGAFVIAAGIPEDQDRLILAKKLGADIAVSKNSELEYALKELSPDGVNVAFECAGVENSAQTCLEALRKQGIYSQIGLFGKKTVFDMDLMLYKEIQLTNSFASEASSWEIALKLIKYGKVNLKPLISAKYPLEDWQEGFKMVQEKVGYKILLIPNGGGELHYD